MIHFKTFRSRVETPAGFIEIDVLYRVRPWGVDLDEVYIADTKDKLPLTNVEYLRLTKEISRHLHRG